MTFASMIEAGYLDSSGNNQTGIDYRFDNCSQTVSPSVSSEDGLALISGAAICVQSQHRDNDFLREPTIVLRQRRIYKE